MRPLKEATGGVGVNKGKRWELLESRSLEEEAGASQNSDLKRSSIEQLVWYL